MILISAVSLSEQIIGWLPALIRACGVTLALTVLSVSAGLVLAVFFALGKISSSFILRNVCSAYIFFFRGTPLMMQLFFVYFALPQIIPSLNIKNAFAAAFIAFTLNVTAYLAEIIRAAILSIDKGQLEASKALGLRYTQAMKLVIIPQAYRRMIPPICNEFVMVIKDTSLVYIIALMDLTTQTRKIHSSSATTMVYLPAMVLYLIMTIFFTTIFNRLEKKLSVYE